MDKKPASSLLGLDLPNLPWMGWDGMEGSTHGDRGGEPGGNFFFGGGGRAGEDVRAESEMEERREGRQRGGRTRECIISKRSGKCSEDGSLRDLGSAQKHLCHFTHMLSCRCALQPQDLHRSNFSRLSSRHVLPQRRERLQPGLPQLHPQALVQLLSVARSLLKHHSAVDTLVTFFSSSPISVRGFTSAL